MKQCPKCKSSEIDTGNLMEKIRVGYSSRIIRGFLGFRKYARCSAFVCLSCGYTELYTDTNKLKT